MPIFAVNAANHPPEPHLTVTTSVDRNDPLSSMTTASLSLWLLDSANGGGAWGRSDLQQYRCSANAPHLQSPYGILVSQMLPVISPNGNISLSRATAGDESPLLAKSIIDRRALRNIFTSNGEPEGCLLMASSRWA